MVARFKLAVHFVVVVGMVVPCLRSVAGTKPEAEASPTARDADLLASERNLRLIRAERLSKEINATIELVRKQFAQDPEASLGTIKRALTTVLGSTDIDPDVRESLRAKVQATIETFLAARLKTENERIQQISAGCRTGSRRIWPCSRSCSATNRSNN